MPWTPASLTGLIGWWDASVTASLSLTGSSINSVADQSGLGNTMTWLNVKPTYSATGFNSTKPAIMLTGSSSCLQTAATFPMGTGNTLTIWAVCTLGGSGTQANSRMVSYRAPGQNDFTGTTSFFFGGSDTTHLYLYRQGALATTSAVTAHPAVHRFIATISAAGVVTTYVDGVSLGTGTSNANWATGGQLAAGLNTGTGDGNIVTPMAEFGVATGYSDAATVAQLDNYLAGQWGFAAPALGIFGTPVTTVNVGSAYGFSVIAVGGTPPYTYSVASGTLPTGITLNSSTGAVSGIPTATGTSSGIVLRVTDAVSATANLASFTITVSPPVEHRVTQVALEEFATTNPAHQVTQTALEMWASSTATLAMGAPGGTIVGQDDGSSNLSWTLWQNGSTPTLDFSVSGTYASKVTVSGGTIPSTGWHHVAVDKDATGKIRLYVDGVMVASNTPANSNFFNSSAPLFIGRSGTGGYYSGWLDEVRVTKGTARYASDAGFIVPTIAFPRMAEPVQPPLVSDTDGFFTPVMTQLAAGYPLLPALVASDDALPAPTVSQLTVFSPVLVASDDAIITPVVSTGVRTLAPPLVVDTDTFGSSFVTLVGLPGGPLQKLKPPPKHQDPETIFAFTSSKMSGIVIDPDTIRVPLVTAQAVILPQFVLAQDDAIPASSIMLFNGTRAGLVPSDDAVFAPLIKMILQPSLVAYDDAIPAADVGWKLFAGRLDDADVIYGPDAYSFYPLYPDLYSEDNSAETYPFLVQALQGGIPVPPREGTLTGSIKKGPHLTGSIASKRVA